MLIQEASNMRNFVALAIGLVLLVSAAAAEGNGNSLDTEVYSEAIGNSVTGNVTIAQITSSASDILGNDNEVDQYMDLIVTDNCLTNSLTGDGSTFAQMGTQDATATGCDKVLNQDIWLNANDNSFVNSDLSQAALQDATGSATQITRTCARENTATASDIVQLSDLMARGKSDQEVDQKVGYNCLTGSSIGQQVVMDYIATGCANAAYQDSLQYARYNSLTMSAIMQSNCISSAITGNDNNVEQLADAYSDDNCLTNARIVQNINEIAESLGCNNDVKQDIILKNEDNSITGGLLIQKSTINSSV
jgi:hypothetical protein